MPSLTMNMQTLANRIVSGDRRALSRAITLVESSRADHREQALELSEHLRHSPKHAIRILDVGTGSGAIALALKANRPDCEVLALDWSKEALQVARKNAERNDLKVEFLHLDALSMPLPEVDLVVSNPPYIPNLERASMEQNVVQFEPDMALFVPQEDPLLFYRQMARQANSVAFEIHHDKGEEMRSMLVNFGYTEIVLQKDLQGKDRIITAHHESRRSY